MRTSQGSQRGRGIPSEIHHGPWRPSGRGCRAHLEAQAQQITQARKVEAIGRLACGLAHDFSDLVAAMLGHAGIVLNKPLAAFRSWPGAGGSLRFRLLGLATVGVLALGLTLFTAWAMWDQNGIITSQRDEIKRLRDYIQHLDERLGIANEIQMHRPTLPHAEVRALAHAIQHEARRYDLDWRLLLAIIRVESGFDPRAKSPQGAVGLMQVMPATMQEVAAELAWAHRSAEELVDLQTNVRVGAHYLSSLVRQFGDLNKAVLAYHLGPSRMANPSNEWERQGHRYMMAVGLTSR